MNKIASTQELSQELRKLLAYTETTKPSREKLAADLRALADRVAGVDKTAMLPGYEVMYRLVGGREKLDRLWSYLEEVDGQTQDLAVEVCAKLAEKLRGADNNVVEAIDRIADSTRVLKGWDGRMHRNNIFKAANALGIKLPSGTF